MKNLMKRLFATALSAAMLLGIGVGASAAEPLSVQVSTSKVSVMQGNKEVSSYSIKSSDLSLSTNSDDKMVLSFKDAASKKRNISLGTQTTLDIDGTMTSLTLDKALASTNTITVLPNSNISKLTVHAGCTVIVAGKANVSKVSSSNKSATIQYESGKKLTTTSVSAPASTTTVKKPTTPTKKPAVSTSSSGVKLTVKAINASKGDTLDNLIDQLNENVIARDGSTDYVMGECKWNYATNREITDDSTMPFTFYPETNDYEPVKGTVKIYADGNSEDITIEFKNGQTYYVSDGMRLSDLTKQVKDDLYVENDNGDSLKYSFKWNSSSSTKFDGNETGRSYTFTITPSSGRYLKSEGTIYVVGGLPQ